MNSISEQLFGLAELMAKEATCPRKSVGCVIVNSNGAVISTGFNGSPWGMPTCLEAGCILEGGHCVRAVHAEARAVARAVQIGVPLQGCTAYLTLLPCIACMQLLYVSGIRTIYFDESYQRSERNHLHRLAGMAGIQLLERNRNVGA